MPASERAPPISFVKSTEEDLPGLFLVYSAHMKKILHWIINCMVLIVCALFYTACTESVRYIALKRSSLNAETWLEVEKNEVVKICIDSKVRTWETSLDTDVFNDSCLKVRVPKLIGVNTINVKFPDSNTSYKINLAVGMKYLDFKNEEVLLGHNNTFMLGLGYYKAIDPKKIVSVTGSYLVDKYPVTNCEITLLLWDDIPLDSNDNWYERAWAQRKKLAVRDKKCNKQDSAANSISLYQALKYANERSIREKLKPYYIFSETNFEYIRIHSEGQYVIAFRDFFKHENKTVYVTVDSTSDGYRLPYYDEWMMFARAGDKTNGAPWGDSATYKDVLMYAQFDERKDYYVEKDPYESGPVGQLKPNKYGLYDLFGLVEEHVLFGRSNRFKRSPGVKYQIKISSSNKKRRIPVCENDCPSCLKGGRKDDDWTNVDYGFLRLNDHGFATGGFRLIRNIGNNAKWSEVKSDKE